VLSDQLLIVKCPLVSVLLVKLVCLIFFCFVDVVKKPVDHQIDKSAKEKSVKICHLVHHYKDKKKTFNNNNNNNKTLAKVQELTPVSYVQGPNH